MTDRTVHHATVVIERRYAIPPAHVFAAWADPAIKAQWFAVDGDTYELDFRVGGQERSSGTTPNGQTFHYEASFYDIVPPQRIVYSYEMYLDAARISVSLATIEFTLDGTGTRLTCTEQDAFLDGLDTSTQREGGIASLLDRLGDVLS
jgi:uncharacterized protein YndB with AHSA1/START domain